MVTATSTHPRKHVVIHKPKQAQPHLVLMPTPVALPVWSPYL